MGDGRTKQTLGASIDGSRRGAFNSEASGRTRLHGASLRVYALFGSVPEMTSGFTTPRPAQIHQSEEARGGPKLPRSLQSVADQTAFDQEHGVFGNGGHDVGQTLHALGNGEEFDRGT